jgi:hypothetical protein
MCPIVFKKNSVRDAKRTCQFGVVDSPGHSGRGEKFECPCQLRKTRVKGAPKTAQHFLRQFEVDGDLRLDFHGFAIQQVGLVLPLLHSLHRGARELRVAG